MLPDPHEGIKNTRDDRKAENIILPGLRHKMLYDIELIQLFCNIVLYRKNKSTNTFF